MIVARIVAIEGKEEELKALLAAVREHSTTKEPLCLGCAHPADLAETVTRCSLSLRAVIDRKSVV